MSYTKHRLYKTCNDCGSNLDHGETCECHKDKDYSWLEELVFIDTGSPEGKDESLLNDHGKYVVKFAKNHGISIAEAQKYPTVKAHLQFFSQSQLLENAL
jgi:hypothetical protein